MRGPAVPRRSPRGGWILLCAGLFAISLTACASPSATPAPATTSAPAAASAPAPATEAAPSAPYPAPTEAATASPAPLATATATASPWMLLFPQVMRDYPPTNTPAPTAPPPPPAPTVAWPAGLDHLTASKLSLHVLTTGDPYVMEFVRRARPRVIKAVGDVGWLKEVKAISPETVTIGRVGRDQEEWILTVDPTAAGVAYVDIHQDTYRQNPFVDYWEGWNEFQPGEHLDRIRWFTAFEASRACTMQARGFHASVGGFSTGVPEYSIMAEFLPALEAAQRCGAIFHLHEYTSPTFECLTAVNQAGILPGAPALNVVAGPLALRYRFWYEGYLKPRGLGNLPLVISELGIDGVKPAGACGDPGGTSWQGYADWWVKHGFGPDGPQAYVNVLSWYDQQLRSDPYVLGATLYTAGATANDSQWHAFDLHEIILPLTRYAVSQP